MTAPTFDNPAFSPDNFMVGAKSGVAFISAKHLDAIMQLPLPGIVIFVHGVNSDGEWYKQAEQGLCRGLNQRLKRGAEHLAYATPEAGHLTPVSYRNELTPDGYLDPGTNYKTFIANTPQFSPVIHFRWGYKASSKELQRYGKHIYLNEQNYWGGGPFANGCTSLPDLWGSGVDDTLFLFLHVQHLNPTNDRLVYASPPRPYFVLAALRLAKLIGSIRRKQADTPITIVCHSQGNMVAMAAAFLGEPLAPAKDPAGNTSTCVADTYVLCNPPYSLLTDNVAQAWTELGMKDPQGKGGRQTPEARYQTLAAFFDIIRRRQSTSQSAQYIDKFIKNELHKFDATSDRNRHGFGERKMTTGRVTLYFNPHDQVISTSTIQGIGWRGLSQQEISTTRAEGVFSQRVFSQGYMVGNRGMYHFWKDQHNKPTPRKKDFWWPPSPETRYSPTKGAAANDQVAGVVMTAAVAPLAVVGLGLFGPPINASPPDDWQTPIQAPPLPEPFHPRAIRFGIESQRFDQGYDAPGESRDKARPHPKGDPYAENRPLPGAPRDAKTPSQTDAPKGDTASEATLRYEHHALLRLMARREGRYAADAKVTEEDDPAKASADYKSWRKQRIDYVLAAAIDTNATDHSTIMTNPRHAEKALAYDVAVGVCHVSAKDLHTLRIAADWRYLDGLTQKNESKPFEEYFRWGKYNGLDLDEWSKKPGSEGAIPSAIANKRCFS
ncbi:T6SS effector phospholipase Tle3 domain-containing protein [Pseudoduganella armeniaca]|uniref:T6SS Tle3 phospholipase effector alpha/beta domain-containing protein n=1 Tax=Pseudoduganella armeniaca TaxID=2072590 RepID=A0A2R4CD14_9BURK|nr:hypothetical protein [Pseudoduganella armeniaca]AVR97499.1 hypothetical protein C9I28_19010 [Pseudoduganella armeniaca]